MDVAAGEYGQVLAQLVASVENGRLIYREETVDSGSTTPDSSCITTPTISQGMDRYQQSLQVTASRKLQKKSQT